MDDIRTSIMQSVMQALGGKADDDTINLVQDVLVVQLNAYEVTERCTEVAVRDESAQGLLKKFLATKRVEGTAICWYFLCTISYISIFFIIIHQFVPQSY